MNRRFPLRALCCALLFAGCDGGATSVTAPLRVLLYSYSTFAIASAPSQLAILTSKLRDWQYEVDASVDPAVFSDDTLARYAGVAMINTCFSPFGATATGIPESQALQRFVTKGGGLFGTHCADVTYQSAMPPAPYNQLIGGRGNNGFFEGASTCRKVGDHTSTAALPDTFDYTGNLDNVDFLAGDTTVVVKCTWGTGTEVPVSWYRTDGAGRVFYTGFAKEDVDLTDAIIGSKHIIPALGWILRR